MHLRGSTPLFFATDLTNFLACRHLTALERLAAHKVAKRPSFDDPMLEPGEKVVSVATLAEKESDEEPSGNGTPPSEEPVAGDENGAPDGEV